MSTPLDRGGSLVSQVLNGFNFSLRASLARVSQPRAGPAEPLSPRQNADIELSDALLDDDPELQPYRPHELLDTQDDDEVNSSPLPPGDTGASEQAGLDPLVAVEMEASGLESQPAAAARAHRHRAKKGTNPVVLRSWVKLDASGELAMIQADKYKITHELGVQTRDLRLLEPAAGASTFPSAILDRERAIVVNLEFIKCIITMDCVYVVNPEDDHVPHLITQLKTKLAGGRGGLGKARSYPSALADVAAKIQFGKGVSIELPFELKALEVCLDSITSHLDVQASDLEAAAYPCLDNLTNRVSTKNLERVRRIKNRMVRLSTRVETILEVLEKFLDDDADMHKLNLTAKEMSRQASAAEDEQRGTGERRPSGSGSSSSSSTDSEDEAEVAEVEMLLEAYFMHVDHTHNRLETLHEYIKDTEDLVNIKLDQHRNQLITIDLIISAFTTVLTCMNVVHGYFGMNLDSGMQDPYTTFLKESGTGRDGAGRDGAGRGVRKGGIAGPLHHPSQGDRGHLRRGRDGVLPLPPLVLAHATHRLLRAPPCGSQRRRAALRLCMVAPGRRHPSLGLTAAGGRMTRQEGMGWVRNGRGRLAASGPWPSVRPPLLTTM